jgi:hypothetical protein
MTNVTTSVPSDAPGGLSVFSKNDRKLKEELDITSFIVGMIIDSVMGLF